MDREIEKGMLEQFVEEAKKKGYDPTVYEERIRKLGGEEGAELRFQRLEKDYGDLSQHVGELRNMIRERDELISKWAAYAARQQEKAEKAKRQQERLVAVVTKTAEALKVANLEKKRYYEMLNRIKAVFVVE